ncbi:MAG: hypothetical protein AB7P24_20555 [Nitrospira sp.]
MKSGEGHLPPPAPTKREIGGQDTIAISGDERVVLGELYPPVMMLQSWYALEVELRSLAERHALIKELPTHAIADNLLSKGVLDKVTYVLFMNLRTIRNRVVHVRPESVSLGEAEKYDRLVQRLIAKLKKQ